MHEAAASFDRYADSYRAEINRSLIVPGLSADFFTRAKADEILRLLTRRFGSPQGLRLLDVGCGLGDIDGLLRPSVGSLQGADVSSKLLLRAAASNPQIAYSHYEGIRLPFESESFDVTFTVCVMHHVPPPDWARFTEELFRVTAPGGIALVLEHNPYNPFTQLVVSRCAMDRDATLLSGGRIGRLLRAAGFARTSRSDILFTPFRARPFRRLDRTLGWIPLGAQFSVMAEKPADCG